MLGPATSTQQYICTCKAWHCTLHAAWSPTGLHWPNTVAQQQPCATGVHLNTAANQPLVSASTHHAKQPRHQDSARLHQMTQSVACRMHHVVSAVMMPPTIMHMLVKLPCCLPATCRTSFGMMICCCLHFPPTYPTRIVRHRSNADTLCRSYQQHCCNAHAQVMHSNTSANAYYIKCILFKGVYSMQFKHPAKHD